MKVSFCCSDGRSGIWLQLLQQALPQAQVSAWAPGAPEADHAVVWAPPQQFFDEQPGLRGIFNVGAGVDALMRLRLPPRAVVVRLDDAGMAVQMAEYACQAVIRHYRQLPQTEAAMRAGGWVSRLPPPRSQFPVGVLGLGVLGRRVALALRHFDFPVLGWSRTPQTIDGLRCCSGPDGLDEVLAASRALICLLPLTPLTRDILNRRNLQRLPAGACVINLARGGHLVEEDLLALLGSGHLGAAVLDVFRTEPLPDDHPLRRHPRVFLSPHNSAATLPQESIAQIAGKIQAFERGEPIAGIVDLQKGY